MLASVIESVFQDKISDAMKQITGVHLPQSVQKIKETKLRSKASPHESDVDEANAAAEEEDIDQDEPELLEMKVIEIGTVEIEKEMIRNNNSGEV